MKDLTNEPVPPQYHGVWQRLSLEHAGGTDTSTRVFWLQTPVLHGDLRIPADRPAYAGKESLTDFSREELGQLARQQGFAGVTRVQGEQCEWLRHIDFQPRTGSRDIGRMQFDGEQVVEEGVLNPYKEVWERLPDSKGQVVAYRFAEEQSGSLEYLPRKGYLLLAGDYFVFARDRGPSLPMGTTFQALLNDPSISTEVLADYLDFEISFGRRTGGAIPWEIILSTLPFREGWPLLTEAAWDRLTGADGDLVQRIKVEGGILTRRWSRQT